jgi:hypothetical protein
MFDLTSISNIIKSLNWILTLGKSDIVHVQKETDNLIRELSKSLTNLWDVTRELTKHSESDFTKERFDEAYDYFYSFYLGHENISTARTHCSTVQRDVGRIKFKIAKILHTDIGKWTDVDQKLSGIVDADDAILGDYDNCIDTLYNRVQVIRHHLDAGDVDSARQGYGSLKRDLENDIEQLRQGVATMEAAINHVRKFAG